jgi:hypothetical protein
MHSGEREPNLLDFTPKYVWREVYQGHWRELPTVQRIEFVVEVAFCFLFFGGFAFGYVRNGNLVGFALDFGTVGVLLAGFFWLLRRTIK